MNNENSNITDINEEILTEQEREALNNTLKENESLSLPKSLSEERILQKLQVTPPFIPADKKEKKKVSANKRIARYIALAASFMIVVSSLLIWEPWNKGVSYHTEKPTPQGNEVVGNPQDYAEIEALFLSYKEKYEENSKGQFNGTFNLYSGIKEYDAIITEDSAASNATAKPGTNQIVTHSTADSANKDSEGGLGSDDEHRTHGETNEQVKGVREADIIKNDGKYIYTLDSQSYYNGYINIFEPKADGKIELISKTKINLNVDKNYDLYVSEMYIKDNELVVLISTNQYSEEQDSTVEKVIDDIIDSVYRGSRYINPKQITSAIVFDITDKSAPKELHRIEQDGYYSSSRLIGDKLVLISSYHVPLSYSEEEIKENCIPRVYTDAIASRINGCDIHLMENVYNTSYIVVSSFNINDKSNLNSQAVLGAGDNFYCNTENLYITTTTFEATNGGANVFGSYTEDTEIHKFYIGGDKIEYRTNGRVKGRALNQFSVDEYKGYLRIATTIGDWGENLSNSLFVLDKDLKVIGEKNYIAKGETIKSVRFAGDTGYVVTFEQTDPLFVLDLSNPESPEIKGELKIPGFSAYLHPITDTLLLGIGEDGTESGTNGGMKVSLFDVSDPTKPKEVDKITVSPPKTNSQNDISYLSCPAYYSHKALCFDSENAVMYIPYGSYYNHYQKTENGGTRVNEYSQAAILGVKVNIESKTLEKAADYKGEKIAENINACFERATYIDDILIGYTVGDCLTSFDMNSGKVLDRYDLS